MGGPDPFLVARAGCPPYAPPGEYLLEHTIIRDDRGTYHLFATHHPVGQEWWSDPNAATLHHAISTDLCRWQPAGDILPSGDGAPTDAIWDGRHIGAPHIVKWRGTYFLFYTGVRFVYVNDADGKPVPKPVQAIGLATSSDLTNWVKTATGPIFRPSHPDILYQKGTGEADARDPFVFEDRANGRFLLYYTARDRQNRGVVAVATSKELVHWQDLGPVLRLPGPTRAGESPWMPERPSVIERDGRYELFFTTRYGPGVADLSMRMAEASDPLGGWQLPGAVDAPGRLFEDQRSVAIFGEPLEVDGQLQLSLVTAPTFEDYDHRRAGGVVVDRLVFEKWPRQVGALFWYWFDCSPNPATATGRNCDPRKYPFHPPGTNDDFPALVDPRDPEWYRREVQDMVYAGIGIVFPISMGDPPVSEDRPPVGPRWPKEPEFPYGDPPGYYAKQSWLLSSDGLVGAIQQLRAPLKVGLLDDMTSELAEFNDERDDGQINGSNYCTIREDPGSGRPRQNKLVGGAWIPCEPIQALPIPSEDAFRLAYDRKIAPYFRALPRALWATHNGRPPEEGGRPIILVFPPAGNDPEVVAWMGPRNEALAAYWAGLKARFKAEFGVEPFILPEAAYRPQAAAGGNRGGADAYWVWNPVEGARMETAGYAVGSIGPGENSSLINTFNQYHPTPRNTIERDGRAIVGEPDLRLRFQFESAWRTDLLLIISWNELLEGHGISRAVDYPSGASGAFLKSSFYLESLRRLLGLPLDREPPRIRALSARWSGDVVTAEVQADDAGSGVERVELFLAPREDGRIAPRAEWRRVAVLSRGTGQVSLSGLPATGDWVLLAEAVDVAGNQCRITEDTAAGCARAIALPTH
jgi:hypothetical protein